MNEKGIALRRDLTISWYVIVKRVMAQEPVTKEEHGHHQNLKERLKDYNRKSFASKSAYKRIREDPRKTDFARANEATVKQQVQIMEEYLSKQYPKTYRKLKDLSKPESMKINVATYQQRWTSRGVLKQCPDIVDSKSFSRREIVNGSEG